MIIINELNFARNEMKTYSTMLIALIIDLSKTNYVGHILRIVI
jgi:hypothetical protein